MPTRIITQQELCTDLEGIIRELEEGMTFVLTDGDQPVAEILPIRPKPFADKAILAATAANLPPIDVDKFMRDVDESVDQVIRDPCTDKPI